MICSCAALSGSSLLPDLTPGALSHLLQHDACLSPCCRVVLLSHSRSPTAALLKVVSAGLLQHNTCPICRTALPVDETRQQEQRRQQRERLEQSMRPRGLPEPLAGLLGGGGNPQVRHALGVHSLLLLEQWRHLMVRQG